MDSELIEKVRAALEQNLVDATGMCICDEAYTSRNLVDPDCGWHDAKGTTDDESVQRVVAVFEAAQKPSDDEREALSEFLFTVYEHGDAPNALREADAILSFLADLRRLEPQTEPTDAQVKAALHAFYDQTERFGFVWRDGLKVSMRAALRAAAETTKSENGSE